MAETAVEREPQRPDGLTFAQPWERVGPRSGAKADALRAVLAEEVRRGHVSYDATTGRYSLNGGLDPELREALRSLQRSAAATRRTVADTTAKVAPWTSNARSRSHRSPPSRRTRTRASRSR